MTGIDAGPLHHHILTELIRNGFAPSLAEMAAWSDLDEAAVRVALRALAAEHGVVLHPGSDEVWIIHPFSTAPTPFLLRDLDGMEWWGNCAWCALGAAALLDRELTITTTLGANAGQVTLHVRDGQLRASDLLVHFPVPMSKAWDNVVYTCSTMLVFDSESAVDQWCRRHRLARGDVLPVLAAWEFARDWYGRHLSPDWRKWTVGQARKLFERHGLTGPIWQLPEAGERF